MSPRPLRQFYGDDRRFVLDGLPPAAVAFARHRDRFLGALESLSANEWGAMSRCDAWSAKDVCNHLVTADGFWALTLAGRHGAEPTTYLRGFDPTTSPDALVAPMREVDPGKVLESLRASTAQLVEALEKVGDDEWTLRSESPFGHVPVTVIAAHSLWDSWLHERDVLVPLGRVEARVEDDELVTATAFTLFFGGAQGGVLDDPSPVGDGPSESIDAVVRFDDLPGVAFRLRVDRDVQVIVETEGRAEAGGVGAGDAAAFVEAVTGRAETVDAVLARLPGDVAAQLERARQIL